MPYDASLGIGMAQDAALGAARSFVVPARPRATDRLRSDGQGGIARSIACRTNAEALQDGPYEGPKEPGG